MKNDRTRIVVDREYTESLGSAVYAFAILEWNAVWCCERIQQNYIQTITRKTAGNIAADFVRLSERHPDKATRAACLAGATEFRRLVEIRNGILHGKPGTAPSGEQRLFRGDAVWSPALIDDAADEFAACSITLNALLHNQLK